MKINTVQTMKMNTKETIMMKTMKNIMMDTIKTMMKNPIKTITKNIINNTMKSRNKILTQEKFFAIKETIVGILRWGDVLFIIHLHKSMTILLEDNADLISIVKMKIAFIFTPLSQQEAQLLK